MLTPPAVLPSALQALLMTSATELMSTSLDVAGPA